MPKKQNLLLWLLEMHSLYRKKNDVREDEYSFERERRQAAGREFNRKLDQKFGRYTSLLLLIATPFLVFLYLFVKGCVTGP